MNLAIVLPLFCAVSQAQSKETEEEENSRVLSETIARFGRPENYTILDLPGPELASDDVKLIHENIFMRDRYGNYNLRFRAITEYFSYNSRYEVGEIQGNGTEKIVLVKGLFGEKISKKTGGYYIRTIGYVSDDNGYRQFLADLSVVVIRKDTSVPDVVNRAHGDITDKKNGITSVTIGSLIGGNNLG